MELKTLIAFEVDPSAKHRAFKLWNFISFLQISREQMVVKKKSIEANL